MSDVIINTDEEVYSPTSDWRLITRAWVLIVLLIAAATASCWCYSEHLRHERWSKTIEKLGAPPDPNPNPPWIPPGIPPLPPWRP